MTESTKNLLHNISIYMMDNQFYIIGIARIPPIGARTEVLPVSIVNIDNQEELSNKIESTKLMSSPGIPVEQANKNRIPWDGNAQQVWNNALKSWEITWYQDGSIIIEKSKPGKKYKGVIQWERLSDSKKILSPSASSLDIVKAILNN
jgi:hypothetical protein